MFIFRSEKKRKYKDHLAFYRVMEIVICRICKCHARQGDGRGASLPTLDKYSFRSSSGRRAIGSARRGRTQLKDRGIQEMGRESITNAGEMKIQREIGGEEVGERFEVDRRIIGGTWVDFPDYRPRRTEIIRCCLYLIVCMRVSVTAHTLSTIFLFLSFVLAFIPPLLSVFHPQRNVFLIFFTHSCCRPLPLCYKCLANPPCSSSKEKKKQKI